MKTELEERVGFILAWGALAVTIFVTDRISYEPANVSKMLLLSVVGFSLLPVIFIHKRELLRDNRIVLAASLGFVIVMSISIFTSSNPFERGLYGAFGRNTGLVAYTSLVIIFITSTLISESKGFKRVFKAFFFAGIVNTALSLWAASGNDVFIWANPYNAVLGTFGNPNFISAFMGIFITFLVVQFLDQKVSTGLKLIYIGVMPFVVATIYFSKALQGTMVAAFGSILAVYFFLRSKEGFSRVSQIYLAVVTFGGFIAAAGVVNKGPLSSYLYSTTVKFRVEYWKAGINMGIENPITGVGADSYGIFYRTFREISATIQPGVGVSTDAAHNVYIDIFSGTGFPGFLAYLVINGFVLFTALRHLQKYKTFDGGFFTLFLCWAGYQLQSIVSINQLGLAVWGWLFGGLLIAYTRTYSNGLLVEKNSESKFGKSRKPKERQINQLLDASTSLKIIGGAVAGLLIALPPFVNDVKFRNFLSNNKGTAETIMAIGKTWPVDNIRLNRIIISLANGNENENARIMSAYAALKFPNDYSAWWTLDQLTREGVPDKEAIRAKLHEIDPFNPDYVKK
jgi:O-antigen ligase